MSPQEVVLVTGSSGYIGSALINELAGRYRLAGIDRIANRQPPPAAECVCIDLTSEHAVKAAFERVRIAHGNRIASVVHLAAYYDLSGEPNYSPSTWAQRLPIIASRSSFSACRAACAASITTADGIGWWFECSTPMTK